MNKLGEYVANHRNKKNLSIRGLAELAHISHTEVSRIENGERKNPSLAVLKALATALDEDFIDIMKTAGYIDDEYSIPKLSALIFEAKDLTDSEIEEVRNFIRFIRFKRSMK